MVKIIPFRIRHRKKEPVVAAPPAFALVSAVYSVDDATVTLTFNRAIDISGFDAGSIYINDAANTNRFFQGTGATMDGDSAVIIPLNQTGYPTGESNWMTATEENGIVALDDGTHWDGVTEYPVETE